MKKIIYILFFALTAISANGQTKKLFSGTNNEGGRISINGYIGDRIRMCIDQRVKAQNADELVEPFRHLTEGNGWQSEFLGKWMLGAIASYEYTRDEELYQKIVNAANQFMETQHADGYIGNYKPESRLTCWDIWGRKYTSLALLSYYRLTKDDNALIAVQRLIDLLIKELEEKQLDIAETGFYYGMPSCSILEPVVYLYEVTKEPRYLHFAKGIINSIEKEGHSQLITKALKNIPVHRFTFPKSWWSYENGQKAYEMMSCYEGMVELGRISNDPLYLQATEKTVANIIADEINIVGSGATFECWYEGKKKQTIPTYHTMETCVTFTWMQLCARLLQETTNSLYADEFERTMYNALMSSMKNDGTQISKYSPLEGRRCEGEKQCGMQINCCNANGPRAFALIPQTAYMMKNDKVYVNLYLDSEAAFFMNKNEIKLDMKTQYPVDGHVELSINPRKETEFTLAFRIPLWVDDNYQIAINGESQTSVRKGGYLYLQRKWKKGDKVSINFRLKAKVEEYDRHQAVTYGPLVFARDSRFMDGYVDECAIIQQNEKGEVSAVPQETRKDSFAWVTMEVPMILGTDLENIENKAVKQIKFCDFASAGNDWNPAGRYRVWIPKTLNQMSEAYRQY
ncbi:hypothetical protein F070042J6_02060 [Bacteroides sp. f07]|uniref:beta-L-arabinofuranosidase domain-containing protein n=1 Tax=Bacteroides sp. f07 TaxID=3132704 RepID=UPI0034BE4653